MTFVSGPEEASFLNEKPAKLRLFVGHMDDFTPGEDSDRVSEMLTLRIARGIATCCVN